MLKRARSFPFLIAAAVLGSAAFLFFLGYFEPPQPRGLSITQSTARQIADETAHELGIEVDDAWVLDIWLAAPLLERELADDPESRRRADLDPVIGPRLGTFRVTYYRHQQPKLSPYGWVEVGRDGRVVGARRFLLREQSADEADVDELRRRADELAATGLPGAPNPIFESVRPTVLNHRTDHTFLYRVEMEQRDMDVRFLLSVHFVGDELAGWNLTQERSDGSRFDFEAGQELVGFFLRMVVAFGTLLLLSALFLRKYHAGEVGVGAGALLFGVLLVLFLITEAGTGAEVSYFTNFGDVDARVNALAFSGIRTLFFFLPLAVLGFLAWAVGESFARERWGQRLASFDALLRRDIVNATVGAGILRGLLTAPVVAAATVGVAAIPILLGFAHPTATYLPLAFSYSVGAFAVVLKALGDAVLIPVVAFLFVLSALRRRVGAGLALLAAVFLGTCLVHPLPQLLEPDSVGLAFAFGLPAAAAFVFLLYDLLAAAVAVFAATLMLHLVPFLQAAEGEALVGPGLNLALPILVLLGLGIAGCLSRREVEYTWDDLAPHVRRIVERERVKAEIDAANRIQAALLPDEDPQLLGVSVSSHYRAASEIGGDYFDFLELSSGRVGVAFGDVAGHGLTSGIVMAMAKSALLVQVDVDPSPIRVMEVLDSIVRRTAPARMMMTFFFGLLDPSRQRLRFSSAGHLDPYLYRAATGDLECLSSWGYPLGLRRREPFRELAVQFEPGDRLVLYSDGLIEAVDDEGEAYGFERFERTLGKVAARDPEQIKQALLSSVRDFTRNRPPEDDQTLVVLGFGDLVDRAVRSA